MLNKTDTTITFQNTMSTFYLKPNILSPTRLNNDEKFPSLIDNIIANSTNDSSSGTIVFDISNNLPIFYSTDAKKQTMNLDIRHTHGTSQKVVWMTLFARSDKKIG